MATTHRQLIGAAALDALKGATDAEDRVYNRRKYRVGQSKLPAIIVYLVDETTTVRTLGSPRRKENVEDLVVIAICDDEGSADPIERMIGQIKDALENSNRLGGLCKDLQQVGLRFPDADSRVHADSDGKRTGVDEAWVGFKATFIGREGDAAAAL